VSFWLKLVLLYWLTHWLISGSPLSLSLWGLLASLLVWLVLTTCCIDGWTILTQLLPLCQEHFCVTCGQK
jgi:hypothetical protein